jgi:hypothetical protein
MGMKRPSYVVTSTLSSKTCLSSYLLLLDMEKSTASKMQTLIGCGTLDLNVEVFVMIT